MTADIALEVRLNFMSKSCQLHYDKEPLKLVRARGQYLYSEEGNEYLDCVCNVSHVGHCHPHVVHAATVEMSKQATSSEYTQNNAVADKYIEMLRETLPSQLSVFFFTDSGSEANDLAITLARSYTGNHDCVVVDGAFHGALGLSASCSPRVFKKLRNSDKQDWVHVLPLPNTFSGIHRDSEPNAGEKYIRDSMNIINGAVSGGRQIACVLTEPVCSIQGMVVPPQGWLSSIAKCVREVGGLLILDEVQTGFGRCGESYWCFQSSVHGNVVPDILTLGKCIANGSPISLVVTTPEIAAAFPATHCLYQNFGNPVSCAAGIAVMQVIKTERLMESATQVGNILFQGLKNLQQKHSSIGCVRGSGMMLGVELVYDPVSRKPNTALAERIHYQLKDGEKIIIGREGEHKNVILLLPPLCFTADNARRFLAGLDRALANKPPSFGNEEKISLDIAVPGTSRDFPEDSGFHSESPGRASPEVNSYADMD